MNIYISTANQYLKILKPFSFLFNLFWPNMKCTVIGYDYPDFDLPENFDFISMGKQEGGVDNWSTDLRKFFLSINDEYFIWATEDQFITYPVNTILYKFITFNYLTQDMGRIGLTNDNQGRPYQILYSTYTYDIIESKQDVNYRLSVLWSIWNKQYVLKYLNDGLSPWKFEVYGSEHAKGDGYRIISTRRQFVIHNSIGVRKGNLNQPLNFNFINDNRILEQNVINKMIEGNIINAEYKII